MPSSRAKVRAPRPRRKRIARFGLPIRNLEWIDRLGRHRRVSLRLEHEFWDALDEIAMERGVTRSAIVREIFDQERDYNFTSVMRVFVLRHYRQRGAI